MTDFVLLNVLYTVYTHSFNVRAMMIMKKEHRISRNIKKEIFSRDVRLIHFRNIHTYLS